MKRLFLFLTSLIVVAVALVAALPFFLSTDVVRNKVAQQLSVWTGREVRLSGPAELTVFPNIAVEISDITIANGEGFGDQPMVAMDGLVARVKLMPLLTGSVEVDRFELIRPRIDLIVDANGKVNWQLAEDEEAAPAAQTESQPTAVPTSRIPNVKLGLLLINDGIVRYHDVRSDQVIEITSLDARLNWPDNSSPLKSLGSFVWNGEVIDFDLQLSDPLAFANNGSSEATLAIASSPARMTVTGLASMTTNLAMNGSLNLDVPSLRALSRWLGTELPAGQGLGELTVQSGLTAAGDKIALSEARVTLDGNAADGAATLVSEGERLYLQATLALTTLDLNPYLKNSPGSENTASSENAPNTSSGWDNEPIGFDGLDVVDADIRVSAAEILADPYDLGAGAIAIGLKDSRLVVELAEVEAYGGHVNGNVVVNTRGARPSMSAKLNTSEITMGPLLNDIAENGRFEGFTNMALDLLSSGSSQREIVSNLSGTGQIQITNGKIVGVDVARVLSGLRSGDVSTVLVLEGGETPFDFMEGSFRIENGVATNPDLVARGPTFSATGAGTVNLLQQSLEYKTRASLLNQEEATDSGQVNPLFEVPLVIRGPWAQPKIRLDAAGIIAGNRRVEEAVTGVEDAIRQGDLEGAKDAVERAIEGSETDVRSLLDSFLNRGQPQPAEPAPSE